MTGATLRFRDLSEQQEVSLRRKVEISVLNCQATPNPQPSESSDLRVIELGDKTGRPQICARSTCQATRMRLFQTDCERLRFMSLACKRPWTSQRFVLRSRQAFSECHLLNCLVFGGAASEHVLMPLSQATTQLKPTDRSPETSFTTLVDISNNPVAACTLQHCNTYIPPYTAELHNLCGLQLVYHTSSRSCPRALIVRVIVKAGQHRPDQLPIHLLPTYAPSHPTRLAT
jgi:hypothetical protein